MICRSLCFSGGPLRLNFGFDLTQWITDQLMVSTELLHSRRTYFFIYIQAIAGAAAAANPIVGLLAMMAVTSLIGIISAVLATIIDIVPPMIPPPM